MKVVAIILIVLQVMSLFGSVVNGSISELFSRGIAYLIGFFFPTIIAVILLSKASKKKSEKEDPQE